MPFLEKTGLFSRDASPAAGSAARASRRGVAYALACALTLWLGRQTVLPGSSFSVLWPVAGVTALWFLEHLRRPLFLTVDVTVLCLITYAINLATGASPVLALWFCVINAMLGLIHAAALRRYLPPDMVLRSPDDYIRLLLICYVGSVVPAILTAVVSLSIVDLAPVHAAISGLSSLARNGSGAFVMICVAVHLRPGTVGSSLRSDVRERTVVALLVVLSGLELLIHGALGFPVLLLILGVQVVLAARCGTKLSSLTVLLTSICLVAQIRGGAGLFGSHPAIVQAAYIQFYVAVLSAVVMVQGGYSTQRTALMGQLRDGADSMERQLQATRESELLFRTAFNRAPLATLVVGVGPANFATVTHANLEAATVLGADHGAIVGTSFLEWVDPADRAALQDRIRTEANGRGMETTMDVRAVNTSGEELILRLATSRIRSAFEPDPAVMLLAEDVTLARRTQNELEFQALHDGLTGLPNRALFLDRLDHALAASGRRMLPVGLLYVDLDGFKQVNDHHGHTAGDELLVAVAARLGASTRPGDTPARLGGDEFALICPEISESGLLVVGRRIVEALEEPFDLPSGGRVHIGASVGAARAVTDFNREVLIREADAAMYRAKRAGKGQVKLAAEPGAAQPWADACQNRGPVLQKPRTG